MYIEPALTHPFIGLNITFHQVMAYIHQLADQRQVRRLFQIFADKTGPLFLVLMIGSGEPVTGKIHQIELCPVFGLFRNPLGVQAALR